MKVEERLKSLEELWSVALAQQKQRVEKGGKEDLPQRLAAALSPSIQDLEARVVELLKEFREEIKAALDQQKAELLEAVQRSKEEVLKDVDARQEESSRTEKSFEDARQQLAELSAWRARHEEDPEAHQRAATAASPAGEAESLRESLDRQGEMLARHEKELAELRAAKPSPTAGKSAKEAPSCFPAAGKDGKDEPRSQLPGPGPTEDRRSDLQVYDDRAEWLIRDALTLKAALPKGEALESPPFNLEVSGVGHLHGLCLRFYPNGGHHALVEDTCSLYLAHPLDMPWSKYELAVGRTLQGPFDPIFGGTDDFCSFSANLTEDEAGQSAVCIGVRFLAKDGAA